MRIGYEVYRRLEVVCVGIIGDCPIYVLLQYDTEDVFAGDSIFLNEGSNNPFEAFPGERGCGEGTGESKQCSLIFGKACDHREFLEIVIHVEIEGTVFQKVSIKGYIIRSVNLSKKMDMKIKTKMFLIYYYYFVWGGGPRY